MAETVIHLERYNPEAKSLVSSAQSLADENKNKQVDPIHLLVRLLNHKGVVDVLQKAKINPTDVSSLASSLLSRLPKKTNAELAYLSSSMLDLLGRAEKEAKNGTVGVEHLLNAVSWEVKGNAREVLAAFDVGPGSFREFIFNFKDDPTVMNVSSAGGFTRDLIAFSRSTNNPVINRDETIRRVLQILSRQSKNNPLLIGEPGTGKSAIVEGVAKRMANGDVALNLKGVGFIELDLAALTTGTKLRNEIEDRLKQVVNTIKQNKDAVVLVESIDNLFNQSFSLNVADAFKAVFMRSDVRVFGTITPDGLRKINEKDPAFIRRFTDVVIDPPSEEQTIEILRGIAGRFEKHHQVSISDPAIVSAVKLAKRYIQDKFLPEGAIDVLDEACAKRRSEIMGVPEQIDQDIQRLSSLKTQRGQLENDNDPSSKKTLAKIDQEIAEIEPRVAGMKEKYNSRQKVLSARDNLQAKYDKLVAEKDKAKTDGNFARVGEIEYSELPQVEKKLGEALSVINEKGFDDVSNVVDENNVAAVVGELTGIPVSKMLEDEAAKLMSMEERITDRVVGQDEAVKAVSKAVRRGRIGLRDIKRPIGSFLFLGPSGVGKTELAKALAEFLFDDEQAMIRLDMSEFQERHNAVRLIGSPPGYESSTEGGQLTNAIKDRPYSVVLFDEVEKAHPDVFNLLLQVLDDGRLSDSHGQVVDFSNSVIVMTSNIGGKRILDSDESVFESDEGREQLKDNLLIDMKAFLRPEFINRIDDTIVFKPLSKKTLLGIVDIQLRGLEKLVADRELKLSLTDAAKTELVELGYEPSFGARPLKRAITKNLQDKLAEEILSGGYKNGTTLLVDVNSNKEFVFNKK